MNKPAVVLLSGGLDSTTTLAIAKNKGFAVYALSFDYGQRNRFEIKQAKAIANEFDVNDHKVVTLGLSAFGGSSLTTEIEVERNRTREQISSGIPSTYVPARNTVFLAHALAWLDVLSAQDIFIGVNVLDASGYPDCRPEFIEAFAKLAQLATKTGTEEQKKIQIHTPLIELTKAEIIKLGLELGVDYGKTITCYDPASDGRSCGHCDSCTLRQGGFKELGLSDPIIYQHSHNS